MNFLRTILIIILFLSAQENFAQKIKSDANIIGHVTCNHCGKHIPFATVSIIGTSIGTATDETGHYQLINLPEGTFYISARSMGYKSLEKIVTIKIVSLFNIFFSIGIIIQRSYSNHYLYAVPCLVVLIQGYGLLKIYQYDCHIDYLKDQIKMVETQIKKK